MNIPQIKYKLKYFSRKIYALDLIYLIIHHNSTATPVVRYKMHEKNIGPPKRHTNFGSISFLFAHCKVIAPSHGIISSVLGSPLFLVLRGDIDA